MTMYDQFSQLADMTIVNNNVNIGVAVTEIIPANATRVCVILANMSADRIVILPQDNPSLTNGWELIQANGPLILWFEQAGAIVGARWLAISDMAASPMFVTELRLVNHS